MFCIFLCGGKYSGRSSDSHLKRCARAAHVPPLGKGCGWARVCLLATPPSPFTAHCTVEVTLGELAGAEAAGDSALKASSQASSMAVSFRSSAPKHTGAPDPVLLQGFAYERLFHIRKQSVHKFRAETELRKSRCCSQALLPPPLHGGRRFALPSEGFTGFARQSGGSARRGTQSMGRTGLRLRVGSGAQRE